MLLAVAALAAANPVAGFPCSSASTAQERLVCAEPELAAADLVLNRGYDRALTQLGAAGRRQLRTSQRAWMRFRDAVCPVDRGGYPDGRSPETCLQARTVQRSAELRDSVRHLGPFRVVRLDGYLVWPAPGQTGWYDGVLTHEERVDWIESAAGGNAQRAAAARLNGALARRSTMQGTRWRLYPRARRETDPGSEYGGGSQSGRDSEIVAASPDAIVARIIDYWMGGAHPWESVSHETFLVPERRTLELADLVHRPAAFRGAAYRRLGTSYPEADFSWLSHAPDVALATRSWEPSEAGLVVHYGTLFGRPSGDFTATLSWREMAPFLSPRGRRIAASFARGAAARPR